MVYTKYDSFTLFSIPPSTSALDDLKQHVHALTSPTQTVSSITSLFLLTSFGPTNLYFFKLLAVLIFRDLTSLWS